MKIRTIKDVYYNEHLDSPTHYGFYTKINKQKVRGFYSQDLNIKDAKSQFKKDLKNLRNNKNYMFYRNSIKKNSSKYLDFPISITDIKPDYCYSNFNSFKNKMREIDRYDDMFVNASIYESQNERWD